MGEMRNTYKILVGNPEGERPLGKSRSTWQDNIKMDLRKKSGFYWLRIGTSRRLF
jgi:hypothetical protein